MSTKYRFGNSAIPHFLTLTTVQWIDLFNRTTYKDILIENLSFCIQNKGLNIHAFVVMSNHLHLIASLSEETESLSEIIRNFKRYTAKVLYEHLSKDNKESRRNWLLWILESQGERSSSNERFKLWQYENHPIELSTNKMLDQRLDYIHNNPVSAGICYNAEDYIYSSASAYAGRESLLEISFLG